MTSEQRGLTLAEAIRRGAQLAPQGEFQWVDRLGQTCALGAAFQGAFGRDAALGMRPDLLLYDRFPELLDVGCRVPRRGRMLYPLLEAIAILNDVEKWSREHIADFVESVVTAASEKKAA